MKIQVCSDLHLNTYWQEQHIPIAKERDVLVLAGDISSGERALPFIEEQLHTSPVIYVPGNHEYYGHIVEKVDTFWKELDEQVEDFHYLNPDFVFFEDVLFVGATLWTNFKEDSNIVHALGKVYMNDFRVIKGFTTDRAFWLHLEHLEYIEKTIQEYKVDKVVVVTHHAPHTNSVHPRFKDTGDMNYLFVSDLEKEILELNPDLWIHGHVHNHMDYMVGSTRIVANPRGYPGEYFKDISQYEDYKVLEV